MRRLVLLTALLLPGSLSAQVMTSRDPGSSTKKVPALVGKWDLSVPGVVTVSDGQVTPEYTPATLSVVMIGDSLFAMLKVQSMEGAAERPATRMISKAVEGPATFVTKKESNIVSNGERRTATAVTTYVFEVKGDSLTGTQTRTYEGATMQGAGALSVSGKRAKS